MSDSTTKRCTKCGIEYPANASFFCVDRRRKSGLGSWCRECVHEYDRLRSTKHSDRRREYSRRWYIENREHVKQNVKRWRQKNRERLKIYSSNYVKKNRAEHYERTRRWKQTHRREAAAYTRNRTALKHRAEGTHDAGDIKVQHRRQRGRCYYCRCKLTQKPKFPNSMTVEHVIPLDRGGSNDPSNLVIACATCNFSKQNKLPHEWKGNHGRLL